MRVTLAPGSTPPWASVTTPLTSRSSPATARERGSQPAHRPAVRQNRAAFSRAPPKTDGGSAQSAARVATGIAPRRGHASLVVRCIESVSNVRGIGARQHTARPPSGARCPTALRVLCTIIRGHVAVITHRRTAHCGTGPGASDTSRTRWRVSTGDCHRSARLRLRSRAARADGTHITGRVGADLDLAAGRLRRGKPAWRSWPRCASSSAPSIASSA